MTNTTEREERKFRKGRKEDEKRNYEEREKMQVERRGCKRGRES